MSHGFSKFLGLTASAVVIGLAGQAHGWATGTVDFGGIRWTTTGSSVPGTQYELQVGGPYDGALKFRNTATQPAGGGNYTEILAQQGTGGNNATTLGNNLGMNASYTPWISYSFLETTFNGNDQGLFVNGVASQSNGARFTSGTYFNASPMLNVRRSTPTDQDGAGPDATSSNVVPANAGAADRSGDSIVRIVLGKRSNGTIDMVAHKTGAGGAIVSTTYYTSGTPNGAGFYTNIGGAWNWYQLEMRFAGAPSSLGLAANSEFWLLDFDYGDNWGYESGKYFGDGPNTFTGAFTGIPEPASLGLLAAGSVLMLARRRKMA